MDKNGIQVNNNKFFLREKLIIIIIIYGASEFQGFFTKFSVIYSFCTNCGLICYSYGQSVV